MRSPTPGPSAPSSGSATSTPPSSPASSPAASPRRRAALQTFTWGAIGFVCSIGVILAVMDPSSAGSASGSALPGIAPMEVIDDGFVPPPMLKPEPPRKRELDTAKPKAPAQAAPGPQAPAVHPGNKKSSGGSDRLERLLKRVRADEKARIEARRKARLQQAK